LLCATQSRKADPAGLMVSDGYSTVRRLSCNSGL
jgi:hypothetical protein